MAEASFWSALAFFYDGRIGREPFPAREIDRQTDQHAHARGAEAPMPAIDFPERTGDQRRGDYAAIDKQIVNLKSVRAPVVARCIKRADLAGEVSLETTNAGQQTRQRDKECKVERHQKMPGCHEQRTDCDCACASEHTVGDQSAAN